MRQVCRAGAAAIVVSFDLDELLENCNRVVVLNRGELFEPAAALAREEIGRLMVSA